MYCRYTLIFCVLLIQKGVDVGGIGNLEGSARSVQRCPNIESIHSKQALFYGEKVECSKRASIVSWEMQREFRKKIGA